MCEVTKMCLVGEIGHAAGDPPALFGWKPPEQGCWHRRKNVPVRAGYRKMRKISTFGQESAECVVVFNTIEVSTWSRERGGHIGEEIFGVRVAFRAIWGLFVLPWEAFFSYPGRDYCRFQR